MVSILEGELAETIGDALIDAGIPFALTVTRSTPGTGPAYNPGPSTVTSYACQGFLDTYEVREIDGSRIVKGDVRVVIIVSTLAIDPKVTDEVSARGKTYSIVMVSTGPARALFELQARA